MASNIAQGIRLPNYPEIVDISPQIDEGFTILIKTKDYRTIYYG
tara:strand:- start:283 stop:414 length:132 start_codon:yes stop_codon:yes gene_type:complete